MHARVWLPSAMAGHGLSGHSWWAIKTHPPWGQRPASGSQPGSFQLLHQRCCALRPLNMTCTSISQFSNKKEVRLSFSHALPAKLGEVRLQACHTHLSLTTS